MRHLLSAFMALASLTTTAQKNNFTIHGSLRDMAVLPSKIYLIRDTITGGEPDSAVVRNGRYEFKGAIGLPVPGWLVTTRPEPGKTGRAQGSGAPGQDLTPPGNHLALFLDKGDIAISSEQTLSNSTITGSKAQDEILAANNRVANIITTCQSLAQLYHENDEMAVYNEVTEVIFKLEPMMKKEYPAYIRRNPNASVNPWLLLQLVSSTQAPGFLDTLRALYITLPQSQKTSPLGAAFDKKLTEEEKSAINRPVADVTVTDAQDKQVSLKSLRGKYIILQFLHSKDNAQSNTFLQAEMANAEKTYKEKGLTTVTAYLDANDAAAATLGIYRPGRNLLIDPNGIVIGRDLNGTKLSETLTSIFE